MCCIYQHFREIFYKCPQFLEYLGKAAYMQSCPYLVKVYPNVIRRESF